MNEFGKGISDNQEVVTDNQVAVYLAKVMGWMSLGLFTTFVVTLLCLASQSFLTLLFNNPIIYYGIVAAQLVVVFGMSASANRISASTATVMFMAYSALMGVTMTVFVLLFNLASIFMVFIMAAALFLTMAVFGVVTKRDLTRMGSLAMFGLFGLIIASLVNLFFRNPAVDYAISFIGIIVFIALTAYDTKKIKGMYVMAMERGYSESSEPLRKASIYGALTLYLDFVNLFIMLLRIFGKRK